MSDIEWTDETWNPVTGCTKVSPGCAHCYAETFAERFRGVPGHPFEQGFDLKLWPERLTKPLGWKKPRKVFVNSMSDLFHEDVPFEFIDRVFAVMALTPQHTYQVRTKRPERMREYVAERRDFARMIAMHHYVIMGPLHIYKSTGTPVYTGPGPGSEMAGEAGKWAREEAIPWPLPNVWLDTSVELQRWADVRIPELLATPAAVRFLSCEPLLGPVDLTAIDKTHETDPGFNALDSTDEEGPLGDATIDWVIVGGESGPGARPFDLAWARSLVSQCRAAGVAAFVKQLGAKPYNGGDMFGHQAVTAIRLKSRKGGDMAEWPEDLRVREWPALTPSPSPDSAALHGRGEQQ